MIDGEFKPTHRHKISKRAYQVVVPIIKWQPPGGQVNPVVCMIYRDADGYCACTVNDFTAMTEPYIPPQYDGPKVIPVMPVGGVTVVMAGVSGGGNANNAEIVHTTVASSATTVTATPQRPNTSS